MASKREADQVNETELPCTKQAKVDDVQVHTIRSLEESLLDLTDRAWVLSKACEAESSAGEVPDETIKSAQHVANELRDCIKRVKLAANPGADADAEAVKIETVFFKIHHVPNWSKPRLEAWLKRQKIVFQSLAKEPAWKYAIVEVPAKSNTAVRGHLSSLDISGTYLACTDVDADAPMIQRVGAPVVGSANRQLPQAPLVHDKREKKELAKPENLRAQGLPDIRDVVAPLWKLPYSAQLNVKYTNFVKAMDQITSMTALKLGETKQPEWLQAALTQPTEQAVCCPALGILRSPQKIAYRNKTEFTVGYNEMQQPTVGFLYGSFKNGFVEVGEPSTVPHTSPVAKTAAAIFTRFLRSPHSQLPAWDKTRANTRGFWRLLVVKEGRSAMYLPPDDPSTPWDKEAAKQMNLADINSSAKTFEMELKACPGKTGADSVASFGWWPKNEAALAMLDAEESPAPVADEVMVMVQVDDTHSTSEKREAELSRWAAFFKAENTADVPCTSFLIQHNHDVGNAAPPGARICVCPGWEGTTVGVHDVLAHLEFHLAPDGFFQVNSAAAACLFKVAGEWASPTENTLLLDVCCGPGTIGLTLANKVKKVIGIDIIQSSIDDAQAMASANQITNCEWVCGKAEDDLEKLLTRADIKTYDNVVAVLDPPRCGLHKRALYSLLRCAQVTRIVYVSCNLETLVTNVGELVLPPEGVKRRHTATGSQNERQQAPEPPKRYKPFVPVSCQAVDMFPQTNHVESLLCLER